MRLSALTQALQHFTHPVVRCSHSRFHLQVNCCGARRVSRCRRRTRPFQSCSVAGQAIGEPAFIWGKLEQEDLIRVTKLDSAGNQLWAASAARDTPDAELTPTNIVASDDGSVIYAFVQAINKTSGTYDSVLAQKLAAADGANLWGDTPVTVVDSSVATAVTLPLGEVPTLISDEAGGAVFGYPLIDTTQRIYVQRVTSTGQTSYAPNGLLVSGDQINASAARFGFDPHPGRLYIAWNANYIDMSGVRVQCVDNAGALLWDEAGIALAAYEPLAVMSPVAMLPLTGGVMAAWIQQPPQGAFFAATTARFHAGPERRAGLDKAGCGRQNECRQHYRQRCWRAQHSRL